MKHRDHFKRMQQKQYQRGAYKNPYFATKKKFSVKGVFIIIAGFVFIIIICIFFLISPTFRINEVKLNGVQMDMRTSIERSVREYLNERFLFVFSNTNRFVFSERKFRVFLEQSFAFEQLQIDVTKNTLSLQIKERTSQFVWKTKNKMYLIDSQGIILNQNEVANQNLPLFVDKNDIPITVGKQILSPDEIKNIFLFLEQLGKQGIAFKETLIDQLVGKWVGVVTQQGFTILFDPSANVLDQALRLQSALKDSTKDFAHLQYIDLRFGDHVYIK